MNFSISDVIFLMTYSLLYSFSSSSINLFSIYVLPFKSFRVSRYC